MNSFIKQIALIIFVFIFVFGCASSNKLDSMGEQSEVTEESLDDFYGVSNDEESSLDNDEQEVLKLLGIQKDEASESEETTTAKPEEGDYWKERVTEYERQLADRDSQIEQLQNELAEKDKLLSRSSTTPTTSTSAAKYSPSSDFKENYQVALSEYNNRNYMAAIEIFESLIMRDRNNSLSDNCRYWIGESYYGLGNFKQAIVEFEKVLSYDESNKKDDAQLKLGLSYLKEGDRMRAKEEFQRLISNFPDSEYISKAQTYISNL